VTTTPYESLVQAASSLVDTELLGKDEPEQDLVEATTFVESNREVLTAVREALAKNCSVPLKYEQAFFEKHLGDIQYLRDLARTFSLELNLAKSDGHLGTASRIGVDMLELVCAVRRGGLVVDSLVAMAIAGIALEQLRGLRTHLDATQRTVLLNDLARIEQKLEPFADIQQRDRQWELIVEQNQEPFDFSQQELSDPDECGISEEDQRAFFQCVQQFSELPEGTMQSLHIDQDKRSFALLRMLSVDLALRSCHAVRESYPAQLTSLVPAFLAEMPLDPFTDEPFLYRLQSADSFLLYSTGPEKMDHGGVFGSWLEVSAGQADLCLDVDDYMMDC